LRGGNIVPLALLPSSAEKDDERLAVPSKISSETGPKIHPKLHHSAAHTLDVRKVALFKPFQVDGNSGSDRWLQRKKPNLEWISSLAVDIRT
jgi:hypothetical protein